MSLAERNELGHFWLGKFLEWHKNGINMRHPTKMEAKRIQDKGEFVVFMEQKVLPLYLRFQGCDYEAQEGAMEYCWQLIRKQIGHLSLLKDIYKPRKALTPEQTATKLVRNETTKVEWDIFRITEAIMDENNWRIIDNRLKDEVRGLHDQGCLAEERDKRRDRLYKMVMHLKEILPEPKTEEAASVIGREKPADKPPTTTQEGLRQFSGAHTEGKGGVTTRLQLELDHDRTRDNRKGGR
jgi:hypothetical protein